MNPLAENPAGGSATTTQAGDEMSRREKASWYRENFLLPRFVVEEDGSKRKLEAGEYHKDSQLYSILTPISELSDFGIGIGMYFTTSLWLGCLMFLCGIIQLPTAVYFDSSAYDPNNNHDRTWKVGGSASCSTEMRVCLDASCLSYAGEFHYPAKTTPRFDPDYQKKFTRAKPHTPEHVGWRSQNYKYYDDDTSNEVAPSIKPFGFTIQKAKAEIVPAENKMTVGKRDCKLQSFFGVSDFVMMIFASITLLVLGKQQNEEAEALDESEQTAQDYSVIIEDPTPEHIDPDLYKEWFEERFGPKTVFSVTVCLDNGPLLRLYAKKRSTEYQMYLMKMDTSVYKESKRRASTIDSNFLSQLTNTQNSKSFYERTMEKLGLATTLESLTLKLLQVNMEISKLKHTQYKACKVFVIFNTEEAQRSVLEHMCCGKIPAALDRKDVIDPKYLFFENLLAIAEAPEPSAVIYENLHEGFVQHCKEQTISWLCLGCGLIVTYFTVASSFDNGQPALGAILISLWNSILPELNKFLVVSFETHHTTEELEDSFLSKTVVARGFCSAIILYVVGINHGPQILSAYYIGSIQAVLLADALTSPAIRFFDLGGNFKRLVLARLADTDEQAKFLHTGTNYLLAERFTDLSKSILMAFFFSAIFPLGYFYVAFACFISFWVDKFCILRIFRQKPPTGDRLVRVTRTFTACIILVHTVITAHYYYGWPFDNLCPAPNVNFSVEGLARAEFIGASTEMVYKQCDPFSNSLLPPTKDQPWFQADGTQQGLVVFYNVVSILTIVYIVVTYFGVDASTSVYALFFYKHSNDSEMMDIRYEEVSSGEGYVPQFQFEGIPHSILAVTAPNDNQDGGLEFDSYLLNWTASAEDAMYVKDQNGEVDDTPLDDTAALPPDVCDQVYRTFNIFFDDQMAGIAPELKTKSLFSRCKQYITNHSTREEASMRNTMEARKSRAASRAGGDRLSYQKQASAALSSGVGNLKKRLSQGGSSKPVVQATVYQAGGDTSMAVIEKPLDAQQSMNHLESMAGEDDEKRRTTTDYPSSMSGGGY